MRKPRLATVAAIVLGAAVGWASPVGADEPRFAYHDIPRAPTIAHGIMCAGDVVAQFATTEKTPGRIWASMAGQFVGISAQPGEHCFVTSTLSWRNHTTGASGTWSAVVSGSLPPFIGTGAGSYLNTGSGQVEFWLGTDLPHLPGTATFTVY
ncbi:MAG: hypothetical protein GX610_10675 [Rhodococcus sp.]|nr:hypothetical protein [Rhodococcus sp. (in: high G+C Gram-positive bacteria)]